MSWRQLWATAAALSVIELDAAAVSQLMLSRPIVVGPLAGLALGDAALGAGLGLLYEFLSLNDPPVGGYLPINGTVAVGTALLIAAGPAAGPVEAAFPAGLTLGWLHSRFEIWLRRRRDRAARRMERRLEAGRRAPFGRLVIGELARQVGVTLLVLSSALALRAGFVSAGMTLPGAVSAGLRLGLVVAPWLAIGTLCRAARLA